MTFLIGILAGSLIGVFVMSLFAVGSYQRGVEDAEGLDEHRGIGAGRGPEASGP